jgi:hypothetical protein
LGTLLGVADSYYSGGLVWSELLFEDPGTFWSGAMSSFAGYQQPGYNGTVAIFTDANSPLGNYGLIHYLWNNYIGTTRSSVGVETSFGTNANFGSIIEFLPSRGAGANIDSTTFAHPIRLDGYGRVSIGDNNETNYTRFRPANAFLEVVAGSGSQVPAFRFANETLSATNFPGALERTNGRLWWTDDQSNRAAVFTGSNGSGLTNLNLTGVTNLFARTNDTWWDVNGAANNATNNLPNGAFTSNPLTTIPATATNIFALSTNATLTGVTIYGDANKTNWMTYNSSGDSRTNSGSKIGRTVSLTKGTETYNGTNGNATYVAYNPSNNAVTFTGNGSGLTNISLAALPSGVVTNGQSSLTFTNLVASTNSTSTTQAALTVFGNQTNYGNFQAVNVGVQYNNGNSYIGVLSGASFAVGLKAGNGIDNVACFGSPLHLDSQTVLVTNNLFVGNTITTTNGYYFPTNAVCNLVISNGLSGIWNSNGVCTYLRYSAVGSTAYTDKALAP